MVVGPPSPLMITEAGSRSQGAVDVVEVERITVSGTGSTPPSSAARRTGTGGRSTRRGGVGAGATGERSRRQGATGERSRSSGATGDRSRSRGAAPAVPTGDGLRIVTVLPARARGAGASRGTREELTAVSGQKVRTVAIADSIAESQKLG